MTRIHVGDEVEAGKKGTEDYDYGKVLRVRKSEAYVAWDSGVKAWIPMSMLQMKESHEGMRTSGGIYEMIQERAAELREMGSELVPKNVHVGQKFGDWKVIRVTATRMTIMMDTSRDLGYKAMKPLTLTWDGKGYKRQGAYMYMDGRSR